MNKASFKWWIIGIFVLGSLTPIIFQTEFWPFSHYSMFAHEKMYFSNDRNRPIYRLVGTNAQNEEVEIHSKKVLGGVKAQLFSFFVQKIETRDGGACLTNFLEYWQSRYQKYEPTLLPQMQSLEDIKIVKRQKP